MALRDHQPVPKLVQKIPPWQNMNALTDPGDALVADYEGFPGAIALNEPRKGTQV